MNRKDSNRSASHTPVCKTHKRKVCKNKLPNVRRSLTITEENDKAVQNARAMFLGSKKVPIDMDYTSMTNLLLELGTMLFNSDWSNPPHITVEMDKVLEVIFKYSSNVSLKNNALVDQLQDWIIKNLPSVIEQYQQMQKPIPKTINLT